MRKIIVLILAALMVFSLAACSSQDSGTHKCKDKNGDCICESCSAACHSSNGGGHDDFCTVCGVSLGFFDENGDNRCDTCDQFPCENVHHDAHLDPDSDGVCDLCGFGATETEETEETVDEPITTAPSAPAISIETNSENAVLTIDPVDGAEGYDIYVNGACINTTTDTTFTIGKDSVNIGVNEVYVCARNTYGTSESSNVVTTGKLADPMYHATGTGVEFLNGDVENAEGYIIYGDDGEVLTTIGLGETFDFADIYTEDGFYFPQIQAYGEGWISSEICGIPVSIGEGGAPIGYPAE